MQNLSFQNFFSPQQFQNQSCGVGSLSSFMGMLSQIMNSGSFAFSDNGNGNFGGNSIFGNNMLQMQGGFNQFSPNSFGGGGNSVFAGGFANMSAPNNQAGGQPYNFANGVSGGAYSSKATSYFPDNSAMEGGYFDRKGQPLYTLQDYLDGRAPYVSVAMDNKAFGYGQQLQIPELEAKYGRQIPFRVVDTGGAFKNQGTSRIDICSRDRSASLDSALNSNLTLVPV